MNPVGDLLERFRRLAAPGADLPGEGVPDDEVARRAAEVAPLLPELAAIAAEAEAIERAASAEAAEMVAAARRRAGCILDEGATRAASARAGAEAARRSAVAADLDRADAEIEVDLRRRLDEARARMPALVEAVLVRVRRMALPR